MYYVAHRLFALHDRALGALVASELAAQVGPERVFLPFCDTDEEALVADCKGRVLYELDRQRLRRLAGMIAVLHGPSLDDGVCMEIGYAVQLGVPVVVLTTDFQSYGIHDHEPALEFPDPLVEAVVTDVVRASRLGPSGADGVEDRFGGFLDRNVAPLRPAARLAVERLLSYPGPTSSSPTPPAYAGERQAFLEPSPYRSERWDDVKDLLAARGWHVQAARRWTAPSDVGHAQVIRHARRDWDCLANASLLIADVNGPEAPPGAALLIGASAAAGRRTLAAYEDRSFTFASGREPNFRNLMIQYALAGRFQTVSALPDLLDAE